MRVVSGVARGRLLRAPAGAGTRPTSDRVREAVFSMLASMEALEGATVLDLFAGSGAMGIEALSRGAASAVFVDLDAQALRATRANLEAIGELGSLATVVGCDALRYLERAPGFDVVLADPPYSYGEWPALLARLERIAGVLVAETGSRWDPGTAWETVKVRAYGGTVVTVARPFAREPRPRRQEGDI